MTIRRPKVEPNASSRERDPVAVRDREPREQVIEGRSWWKDPVGDSLLGLGVVGLGVGTVFIVSGHNAENDKLKTTQLELVEKVKQDPYQVAQILQNWLVHKE